MNINCEDIVEKYLLNQNPLYAFSFPISILIAIIVFGVCKAYKISENSYINQILIPITALLLVIVIIDILSRFMISKNESSILLMQCKNWKNNKVGVENFKSNHVIEENNFLEDIEDIEEILINTKKENIVKKDNLEIPISEINGISPSPLNYIDYDSKCIENSNCCSLCSDTNNPCNIIAPIPGPQWLPQSAKSVQDRLVNNNYTASKCEYNN